MLQLIYLTCCVLGSILPYSQFLPFLAEHGLDLQLFFTQLFANRISSFFAMDFLITSLTLWVLLVWEGKRLGMKNLRIYFLTYATVGISLALPLFLLMRERKLEQSRLLTTKAATV
jgi:hypothetical protein